MIVIFDCLKWVAMVRKNSSSHRLLIVGLGGLGLSGCDVSSGGWSGAVDFVGR